jgi:F-type H+-transporting ATPase subunit delta
VVTRYAQALLAAAEAGGVHEGVAESYQEILGAVKSRSDLTVFIESPQVATQEKKDLIAAVFAGRVEPVLIQFIQLLIDKNRIEFFRDIGEEFARLVEGKLGFERAIVTTAVPLPDDLAALLSKKLEAVSGAKIILEKKIDPEVIGGVCVTMGDKILDGTVRTNLDLLSKHLGQAQVR